MTKKKGGLGRGLEALLGDNAERTPAAQDVAPSTLPIDRLVTGKYQPRTRMDEGSLTELAESIRVQGVMQPVLVRPIGEGRYEIIAGERRVRASTIAGLSEIPVLVRDVPDESAAAMALIENIQREDLNPLEEAQGVHRLIAEFHLTHEDAAKAIGRSRSATSNLLRLLNLAKPVQTMLMAGDLDMGHARALLSTDAANQIVLANQIIARRMSVREAERLVVRATVEPSTKTRANASTTRDVENLETELSDRLAAQVHIKLKSRGHGQLTIDFGSLDQLDGLLEVLRGTASRATH